MGCETPGRTMPAAERLALDSVILDQWLRFYWLEETETGAARINAPEEATTDLAHHRDHPELPA